MALSLDVKDRKILLQLDMDARKADSSIAKDVGLSKQVVNYRIKRLEKNGVIRSYSAVVDHAKLGLRLYRLGLKLENADAVKEKEIIAYLTSHSSWIASVLGPWDVWMGLYVKDEYDFMEFWKGLYSKYGYYIKDRLVTVMTGFWNLERSFIFPSGKDRQRVIELVGTKDVVDIDDVDEKILSELTRDARQNSLELSKRIGETERVVRYRIKRLEEEKVILGYRVFLDTSCLDVSFYKLFIQLHNAGSADFNRIREYLMQDVNVAYMTEALGGPDLELEAYFPGSQELYRFISLLKEKFPMLIKDVEHMEYMGEYKMSYFPTIK